MIKSHAADSRSASYHPQLVAAEHLIPRLEEELAHEARPNCLRRWRGLTEAMTCDFCATSLFSSSFFCQLCGHEFCRECFQRLEQAPPGTGPKALLKCMPGLPSHQPSDFLPVTRFEKDELEVELGFMKALMAEEEEANATSAAAEPGASNNVPADPNAASANGSTAGSNDAMDVDASETHAADGSNSPRPAPLASAGEASTSSAEAAAANLVSAAPQPNEGAPGSLANGTADSPMRSSPLSSAAATREPGSSEADGASTSAATDEPSSSAAPAEKKQRSKTRPEVASHIIATHHKDDLDEEVFLETWGKGEPLLVKGVALAKDWDPERFISMYGDEVCEITTCEDDDVVKEVFVRQFFETFGLPKAKKRELLGKGTWKLKVSERAASSQRS